MTDTLTRYEQLIYRGEGYLAKLIISLEQQLVSADLAVQDARDRAQAIQDRFGDVFKPVQRNYSLLSNPNIGSLTGYKPTPVARIVPKERVLNMVPAMDFDMEGNSRYIANAVQYFYEDTMRQAVVEAFVELAKVQKESNL